MARRTRSRSRGGDTRRKFLFRVGAGSAAVLGIAAATRESGAFSSVIGDRTSSVDAAPDGEGLVGIVGQGPVKKNNREPMVELTNNAAADVTYTVTLDNCGDGTLYDNEGGSGCSVSFTLAAGNTRFIDIDADVTGFIGYSISASGSGLSLDTTGTVEAQSGNVATAVLIQHPTKDTDFHAVLPSGGDDGQFELDKVDVRDDDGDNDLVEVKYEVREGGGSGTIIASKTVSFAATDQYKPGGSPAEVIQPNAGYTVKPGTTYSLTTTGTDADGNFNTETVEDTSPGTPTPTQSPTASQNDPPTASFTMSPAGGNKVDVDASGSSDADGSIVSYEWFINNTAATGTPDATGVTATLNPVKNNDTVTLLVTDDDGATDKATQTN